MIQGKCYYFESTNLTYSQARESCHNKFGKLFEPQSVASNQAVYNLYQRDFRMSGRRWIGINSLKGNGYRFDSNGQIPPFDIDNMWHSGNAEQSYEMCVAQSEDDELWFDRECSSNTYQSLCELSQESQPSSLFNQINILNDSIVKGSQLTEGKKKIRVVN